MSKFMQVMGRVLRPKKRPEPQVPDVPTPKQKEPEFTKDDMMVAQMLSGATFGDGAKIVLPSGAEVTGKQINDHRNSRS